MSVKVRALEWSQTEDRYRGSFRRQAWTASASIGSYKILHHEEDGSAFGLVRPGERYVLSDQSYSSLSEAKAAAQADYSARVLSAIEQDEGAVAWLRNAQPDAEDAALVVCARGDPGAFPVYGGESGK